MAPDVPVVGHLHGTELLMLERIADGPPAGWDHAEAWARADAPLGAGLRAPAAALAQPARARRAPAGHRSAPLRRSRPTASTPSASRRGRSTAAAFWRHALVDDPHGWRPGPRRGLGRLPPRGGGGRGRADPSCSRVSRFTEVKRLGLLVRAFARAREALRESGRSAVAGPRRRLPGGVGGRAPLRRDPRDRRARRLPRRLARARRRCRSSSPPPTSCVLASVREQFGSVLVEGMACGLPADRGRTASGRRTSSRPGQTGWLVEPDDEAALADALAQAIDHPEERRRRGAAARRDVARASPGPRSPTACAALFAEVVARPPTRTPRSPRRDS